MLATLLTLLCHNQADMAESETHSYKLYKPNFRLHVRKFSFSLRVINICNALPYSVL